MISPLAYVDPSAKIGKNVTIHALVTEIRFITEL